MAATTVDSLVQRLVEDNSARRRALEDEVVASKRHNAYLEETLVALQRTAQRQETDLAAARAANTVLRGGDEALALQRSIQDLRGLLEQRNAELSSLQAALRRAQEEPELRADANQPAAHMGRRGSVSVTAPDAAACESIVTVDAVASFADEGDEPEVSLRLCPAAGPRRWSGSAHPRDASPWVAHSDDRTVAGEVEAHPELDSVMSPRAPARRQHAAHHRLSGDDTAPRQAHVLHTGPLPASSAYSGVDGRHMGTAPSPAFFAPPSPAVAAAAPRAMSPQQRSGSPRFNGSSSTGSGDGFWRAATHVSPMEPLQPPPAFAPGGTRVALLMRPTPASLQWVRAGTRPPLLPPPSSATPAASDSRRSTAPEPHLPFKSGAHTPTPMQPSPRRPASGVGGSGTGFGISHDRPLSASWAGSSSSRHTVPAAEIEQRYYAAASPAAQALRGGQAAAGFQENPSRSATLPHASSSQEQLQRHPAAPSAIMSASSLQVSSSPAFRRGDPATTTQQPQAAMPGTPQHVPSPSSRPAKPQPPGQPQSLRSQYPGAPATATSPARPVLPQSASLPPPHAFSLASRSPPPPVPPVPLAPVPPGSSGHAGVRAATTTTLPTSNESPATDADSACTAAAAERVQASIRQLTLELEQLRGGHREGGGGISTGGSSGRSAGGPPSPAFPRSPPPPQAAASARSAAPTAAAAAAATVPKRPSWQDTLRHLDAAIAGRH